ncbi:MAG: hypothetical protein H7251_02155 [Acetobacteraceae bacterium]|nr:hypothetical protein [Acetobacteraceae bacterium]
MTDRHFIRFVFLAVFAVLAFIGPATDQLVNPNMSSRLALALEMVEDHAVTIDRFAPYTIDKASYQGHFYSDKAPGMAFLVAPLLALLRAPLVALGIDTTSSLSGPDINHVQAPGFYIFAMRIGILFVSTLATAGAAAMLFQLCRDLRASRNGALFASFAWAFATPMLGWATSFFGHATAASLLVTGLALVVRANLAEVLPGRDFRRGLLAGFALGLVFVVEFTTGPALVCIAVLGLFYARGRPLLLAGAMVGGLAPLILLLVYNQNAFGAPLHLGYANVVDFAGMQTGWFGVSRPDPHIAWEVLFGASRGLVWISPFLLLAPLAYVMAWREMPRGVVLVLLAVPVLFLLINAGYAYWDGGWSTGPRHLTPGLAFACVPFAALWDRGGRGLRLLAAGAVGASAVLSLSCAMVDMTSRPLPDGVNTVFDSILPRLAAGDFHNSLTEGGPNSFLTLLALPVIVYCAGVLAGLTRNAARAR